MDRLLRIFGPIARIVLPKVVVVGLDIQDRHIAQVASSRHLTNPVPITTGIEDLPESAIEDGKIADEGQVFQAVRNLTQGIPLSRLKNEPVFVLSLPPHHIYTETALFPLMNEKTLEEAIKLKLETALPWPPSEAYVDWRRLDVGNPQKIAVFITAAPKTVINRYLGVFYKGKWRVAACEFHLMSLARLIKKRDEPFVFVLVDEDGAEFALVYKGAILTHLLEKKRDDAAVQEKLNFQVRRFAAYADAELGLKVNHVLLFDRAGIEKQLSSMETIFEIPVQYFVPPSGWDPRLFIAAGASFHALSASEESANLIPIGSGGRYHEHLTLQTLRLWTNILVVFALILTLSFGAVFAVMRGQREFLENETKMFDQALDRQIVQSGELLKQAVVFNQLVAVLANVPRSAVSVGDIFLSVLGEAKHAKVEFRRLRKQGNKIVVSAFAETRERALDFKLKLELTQKFSSVEIPFAELIPENNLIINVSLTL